VRRVCPHCAHEVEFGQLQSEPDNSLPDDAQIRQRYAQAHDRYANIRGYPQPTDTIRLANVDGCSECDHGYMGRAMVSELAVIDAELKSMIARSASSSEMLEYAQDERQGHRPLWDHGIELWRTGQTTLDELENILGTRQNYGRRFSHQRETRQL